jgi:hypothetical protein
VELLPGAEPPVGFEQRVITALAPPPSPRARPRWMPAAAVTLAVAFAAGGWILGRSYRDVPPPETDAQTSVRTVMFTPLTAGDHPVGQAYVYPGRPSWIFLSLDTDSDTTSDTIRCEMVHRDGSTMPLGTFTLTKGYGAWVVPTALDRNTLATIRLINDNGHTLATAQFTSPVPAPDEHTSSTPPSPPQQPPGRGEPRQPSPTGTGPTAPHPGHQQRQDHQERPDRKERDHHTPDPAGETSTVRGR